MPFDPDGPASGGLFGLEDHEEPAVAVLSVPVEVTTSAAAGTAGAPRAVVSASHQVDLEDLDVGPVWEAGITLDRPPSWLADAHATACNDAANARVGDHEALERVNRFGERVADWVRDWTSTCLAQGRIPAILGGDHSVPLGAIQAASAHVGAFGILHIDAHADLRESYEGFVHSHASIFHNVAKLENVTRIVQVGLRDVGRKERLRAEADTRIEWWTDRDLSSQLHTGTPFLTLATRIVASLPHQVWVSFDVDGLDPSLCPNTGTPVPGGLSWREAITLLRTLSTSGRRVVGFDLCEVGPEPWDANVGARLLYKLAGFALHSQRSPSP